MIRHMKIARDTAVKSRSQAMVALKTLIINAPADLRETLDQIKGKVGLIRHIAAFRPAILSTHWPQPKPRCVRSPAVGCGFMKRSLRMTKNSSG